MKSDNCCFCKCADSKKLYNTKSISNKQYSINKCSNCGCYFLSPHPTEADLSEAYSESYYGVNETKFPTFIESILDYFRKNRSRRVQRFTPSPANILDIGCGNGRFLGYLIDEGYDAYGIELPGKSAQRAAQINGLNLSTDELKPDSYPQQFFDAISMWHVFEHLKEPKTTLDMIDNFIKPGGHLFISLPNIESMQSKLFKGNWLHLDPPKHLFFLNAADLIKEMKSRGYSLEHRTFMSIEQNPFGIQQSLLNCVCSKRELLFEHLKGNKGYTSGRSKFTLFLQKAFFVLTFWLFAILASLESISGKGGTMELVFRKIQ